MGVREAAEAALAAPAPEQPRTAHDLLLDGLATRFTVGYEAGVPTLRRALHAFRGDDAAPDGHRRWLWLACKVAQDLWDDDTWETLATRHIRLARSTGALAILPLALSSRVVLHLFAGELTEAAGLIEELQAVVEATGSGFTPYGALLLAAMEGTGSRRLGADRRAREGDHAPRRGRRPLGRRMGDRDPSEWRRPLRRGPRRRRARAARTPRTSASRRGRSSK